ncbi:7 transmembrane receptor (rhodopsin family)-like protein 12 [Sarcoptes scabiei]|uniref:7 transmembrane receptor (Rhodopsin family)-like protein 12 n=1 Tax=Sarcoptes scabiei TaxID=52283 RepID=A0A132AH79_SARSC|nr:7 transmembrane receptor (rhodopsin family)-like protein 12 [Sarcoptes scabiei]
MNPIVSDRIPIHSFDSSLNSSGSNETLLNDSSIRLDSIQKFTTKQWQRKFINLANRLNQFDSSNRTKELNDFFLFNNINGDSGGGGGDGEVIIFENESFSIDNFEIASKELQLCLTILYSVTAALALIGNLLSIMVLLKDQRSSRDLRLFLVNLSLSDILMSVFSIPFTYTDFIMGRWMFDPKLCPIVQSMQIVSPFIANFWTKSFAPIIVILTWLAGGTLGLVIWFFSKAEPFTINNVTYYDCRESWSSKHHEQIYTVALFLSVFALPLLCLIYFYGSICLKLWYHLPPGNANAVRDNVQFQAKRKVIKMLVMIVALFAICWFPSHLFQLIRVFNEDILLNFIGNDASSPKYLIIVISSHWLSMAHSFVNPIIYSFMSDNFKVTEKKFFKFFK